MQQENIPTTETQIGHQERRGVSDSVPHRFHYRTYGLQLSSQLELPELAATPDCSEPDIDILTPEISEVMEDASPNGPWVQVAEERCQLLVEGVARYRIEQGRRILVDRRVPHAEGRLPVAGDVRLYLLGAALGVLLHQRYYLPLHVSALQTPAGVWAFTGHSGAGKSTLGAWLHYTQGWPMVSDDVAVIKPEDEQPILYPGPARLKLWKDALAALDIDRHGLVRDLTRADKYHLMLRKGFQADPQPLRALVVLERAEEGEAACLEPVTGVAAFKVVMASLYRPELGKEFNGPARLLHESARLADRIGVYRFRRPWSLDEMDTSIEPLLQHIEGTSLS
ncbi:hypothetical protein L861_02625 [Litchfieldella anticariensis FP35 = DSM 16096]|uniref:HPr kinase n=2 Tax=Litchfieldella anticariensis TaxID=258591 RepID=S2KUG9_LITA3|nr:hypothetical protein L861_02625 [Halomonas anticariensis FP35 = DSM 16096]